MRKAHTLCGMTLESVARTDTAAALVAIQIRMELARRGRGQADLARALGESPVWVSERLNGKVQLTFNDFARIAQVLEMKMAELLPHEERTPRSPTLTLDGFIHKRHGTRHPDPDVLERSPLMPVPLAHGPLAVSHPGHGAWKSPSVAERRTTPIPVQRV